MALSTKILACRRSKTFKKAKLLITCSAAASMPAATSLARGEAGSEAAASATGTGGAGTGGAGAATGASAATGAGIQPSSSMAACSM
jgi:hypothetical protein